MLVLVLQELAIDAVRVVMRLLDNNKREVEIKKYAKIEKIPGGAIEDCKVLDGVMFTKDVVNPSRMKRVVENPRILLLDCPVEYKKGENQTNVELVNETDFAELLRQEEEVWPFQSHPIVHNSGLPSHRTRTALQR
jgi:T-complex protein 1 subunit gamma